ncbi:ABC transporter ATP-binding protein/permease [Methylomagnum sp.]
MLHIPINEQGWGLFARLIRELVRSEVGGKAVRLFLLLIALFLGVNLLNVVNSYVGRDFMSAIAERNTDAYVRQALLYIVVFAASTAVAVYLRFCEERLGLLWRAFMTRGFVDLYLKYPTYYRINDETIRREVVEFPDQRITEDVRTFTVTTLSFVLLMVNGVFTIVLFSGVLWSISPWLFGAALAYSVVGSYFAVRLGIPLVDLNYTQLDKEAAFRSDLIHVREKAESVALLHRENEIKPRLHGKITDLAANFRKIIQVNRSLGFFTTGYNYLVQIIPVLLVAPLYMRGDVEFGVITQSVMAFAMLVGAFSLIVNWFQSISSYYAVIQRLINFWYAIEVAQTETVSGMDVREEDDRVAYDSVTLHSPVDGHVLVRELSVEIAHGTRTLVTGLDDAAKDALFKATVGIFDAGTGCVRRPTLDRIMFLPERAYLPPGTLRQALVPTELDGRITDAAIVETLTLLGIESVLARAGGLDEEHDWDKLFSLHEQRFVSFARILLVSPRFAVLYNPFKDLDAATASRMLGILSGRDITYLTVGFEGQREGDDRAEDYDALLELTANGGWNWRPL